MEIKEITDITSIFKMIDSLYKQFPAYAIIDKKPVQIKILAIKSQGVFIQTPEEFESFPERLLFFTNAGNLIKCKFKVVTTDPRGIELLYPISISIQEATRTNSRYQATKIPLYISNIISQSMIPHDLSDDTMKVESFMKPYINKLKAKYDEVNFFIHERMDIRMRLIFDTGKHLFIPDSKQPESVPENFIAFSDYMHLNKQSKDFQKYMSEICVPLKYKNLVLFGYLQVLNLKQTDVNDYNLVLHAANKFCTDIENSDVFNVSKHKSSIMDISSTGLSFSHPQSKQFGKLFSLGGIIFFEMFEGDKNLGIFRAVVRNIKPLEKLFRIGCQFFHTASEHQTLEELMQKYFPEIYKEEEESKRTKRELPSDKPKTKADTVLDSLSDEDNKD